MNAFPSGGGGHGAHLVVPDGCGVGMSEFLAPAASSGPNKRKRRPAGTPDPDAEVVALSPKTLMESERYVCEICNQGFQRDQNLQMHRRRHKVPWKLLKRPNLGTNKRVYICPERSCLHHDAAHALGDLVGIKKHYRRKHCTEKQWKCEKCSKGYAVQSDYKAHLKTCGTRGHCCDCGRVFSRVESFIEHQDTCSAVRLRNKQSEGGTSERLKSSIPYHADGRNASHESPSQSSDTTQAMSFAQSEMSDTAARSLDIDSTKVLDEHSRRIQDNQAAAIPSTTTAAMPAWLTGRRNELELLPTMQRVPADHDHSDHFILQEVRPARADLASRGSIRSQVTRCCSTINSAYAQVTCPEVKVVLEPSLQLSIGPACGAEVASSGPSPYTDIKPSFSSFTVEREGLALTYHQKQFPSTVGIIERLGNGSLPLALSIPETLAQPANQTMEGPGTNHHAVSLSGFFLQTAARRPGPDSQVTSSGGIHQSTTKHENRSRTEMVSNYNPACAGSTSSYHENRAGNVHKSDPVPGTRATRRRSTNSQLEPATSSVITSRQALRMDVAETDHLFAANSKSVDEAYRSLQKQMAAAARAKTDHQPACEQTRTDMNATWSELAKVRRTTAEARQECDEAQSALARAEILKREAREQLQLASAEKAYADRAREDAKRQIEISEAELANAKRLREHSQAELEKAGSSGFSQPTFCHSCKSAIESTIPSIRRSTPTSLRSWSMMTPSTSTEQLEAGTGRSTGAGQIFMNPGSNSLHELLAKHVDQAMGSNISDDSTRAPMSVFNNSVEPWYDRSQISALATSMAIGESPPSGGNRSQVPRSDWRDQTTPKDLDLN